MAIFDRKTFQIYTKCAYIQTLSEYFFIIMQPEEVVAIRKSLKMTQEEFGQMIGKSRRAVQSWENGTRSIPKSAEIHINTLSEHSGTQTILDSTSTADELVRLIDEVRKGDQGQWGNLQTKVNELILENQKLRDKIRMIEGVLSDKRS